MFHWVSWTAGGEPKTGAHAYWQSFLCETELGENTLVGRDDAEVLFSVSLKEIFVKPPKMSENECKTG